MMFLFAVVVLAQLYAACAAGAHGLIQAHHTEHVPPDELGPLTMLCEERGRNTHLLFLSTASQVEFAVYAVWVLEPMGHLGNFWSVPHVKEYLGLYAVLWLLTHMRRMRHAYVVPWLEACVLANSYANEVGATVAVRLSGFPLLWMEVQCAMLDKHDISAGFGSMKLPFMIRKGYVNKRKYWIYRAQGPSLPSYCPPDGTTIAEVFERQYRSIELLPSYLPIDYADYQAVLLEFEVDYEFEDWLSASAIKRFNTVMRASMPLSAAKP